MNERPRIGLSGLVLAEVLSDDENGIVYGTPFKIPGAVGSPVAESAETKLTIDSPVSASLLELIM